MPSSLSEIFKSARPFVLAACITIAILACFLPLIWVGYTASDDSYYLEGGRAWLEHFPFVAHNFGVVRHTVVIPIAIIFGLFGESNFTLSLSTVIYFLGLLLVTWFAIRKLYGFRTAVLAYVLTLLTPLFAIQSTIASVDMPIVFFVASSFWLYIFAVKDPNHRVSCLLLSGVCTGLAIMSRETEGILVIFYGVLFLAGYGMPRKYYWLIALGCAFVTGSECLYFWAMTGNPLYRLTLLREGASEVSRGSLGLFSARGDGNIRINKFLDPLLVVLVNQEFGLIYYVAAASTAYLFLKRKVANAAPRTEVLLVLMAVMWFVLISVALSHLRLNPRYYFVPTYACDILIAIGLGRYLWLTRPKFATGIIAILLSTNFLCMYLENKNPDFGPKSLVTYAASVNEPIYTDERTYNHTEERLKWAGEPKTKVIGGPPPPGSLFFLDARNAYSGHELIPPGHEHFYSPTPGWREVARFHENARWIKYPMDLIGANKWLNENIYDKITSPNPDVFVYRVGGKNSR